MAAASPLPPSPIEDKTVGAITMLPRRAAATASHAAGLAPAMTTTASGGGGGSSSSSVSALTHPGLTTGTTAASSAMPSPPEIDEAGTSSTIDRNSLPTSAARRSLHPAASSSSLNLTTPQTGAGKMAAAAAAAMKRPDDDAQPPEEHPLSDKALSARGYHTLHAMGNLFHLPNRWRLLRPLGQGAYGLVISVQDSVSGEPVAVKCITRVFDKSILAKRALREITLLRHFGEHENLTGLIDLDNVWDGYNEIYLYMEPMEADLHQIVRSGQPLSNLHIQFFLYQLLRGMKYIHSANVIHRDLKPGNLLVNSDCELKICDFGLARGFRPATGEEPQNAELKMTEYVATRWYRAPEIMLSNKRYTTAIDVWSIGCILGELLGGKPMFKGKDYVDQLNLILGVLGTPDNKTLESMSSEKARTYVRSLPHSPVVPFATILPEADPQSLDLLGQLLQFDPTKRIDVVTALEHPYVGAYHDPADEPECEVFDGWEQVEKLQTVAELREALTREIHEYRAEVRGMAQAELESAFDEGDYQYTQDEMAEPEPLLLEERGLAAVDTENVPDSPEERTGSPVRTRLSMAAAAGRSPTLSPRRPRPRQVSSYYTPRTPRTPGVDTAGTDESFGHTPTGSRRPSRRSSSHSVRRSKSFLFGGGISMSSLAMTSSTAPPQAVNTASSSEYTANSAHTPGTGGIPGGMAGRRSRAPSGTIADLNKLRPLIRQLSTTNIADLKNAHLATDEPLITEAESPDGPIIMSRRGSRRASAGSQ